MHDSTVGLISGTGNRGTSRSKNNFFLMNVNYCVFQTLTNSLVKCVDYLQSRIRKYLRVNWVFFVVSFKSFNISSNLLIFINSFRKQYTY